MSRTEKSRRLRAVSRGTALFFLAASMGLSVHTASPVAVFAATKPINTVSIKVTSKLEPGVKLPKIQIGGTPDTGGVSVSGSGSKYSVTEAEWVDKSGNELKAAEEPQMRVTLEPEDVSEDYFPASYKSSSVKISGGTFVSARRDGDNLIVTLRVKGVKGDFGQPEEAYWNENNLGEARWEKPDNASGYYEVQLYRDSKQVYRVAQTSSLQYNFYPYMTKAGDAIEAVSDVRASFGAAYNHLQRTHNNLSVTTENMTAAENQIRDTNMAQEFTDYTAANIQLQVSDSMLSQANALPDLVLKILNS